MGQFRHAESMFRGVSYNKFTSVVIKSAMEKKILALKGKIEERRGRVSRLMSEHRITSEMLADMIIQYMKDQQEGRSRMSYSNSARSQAEGSQAPQADVVDVPAGAIANLITEKNLIESEGAEVKRLELIVRNLKELEPAVHADTGALYHRAVVHTLSDEEIEYLGF